MASERVDRILDVLDAGLQSSPEASYGEHGYGDRSCVRCQSTDLEPPGEFCGPCRSFLLGDSEVDPARPAATSYATVTIRLDAAAIYRRVAAFAGAGVSAEETIAAFASVYQPYEPPDLEERQCAVLDQWIPSERWDRATDTATQ